MKVILPKLLLSAGVIGCVVSNSDALPVVPITTPDGMIFSEFGVGDALTGKESQVNATLSGSGTSADPWAIVFDGPLFAKDPGTGDIVNLSLRFKVQAGSGQLISSIEQGFLLSGNGLGNTVTSLEKVWGSGFNVDLLADSALTFTDVTDPDPNLWQPQKLNLSQPKESVWITKDVQLDLGKKAEAQTSELQITVEKVGQRILTVGSTVPDSSSTAALVVIGMAGLAMFAPRSERKSV